MPKDKGQNRGQEAATCRARTHATETASHSDMGPDELLREHMDASGNAVPDESWGPTRKADDDADLVEAMNAETKEFERD
ncbi:hypothetical protein PITC_019140 [Penicillium italicum]|uniref:Uncharacterized protein n=1 Tax=Penicillium italicum TaxID=40296 RepID=A0A0A2L5E0_PENIT|nr:hypothetical protein PITC_019140 [Penicillium italicum]